MAMIWNESYILSLGHISFMVKIIVPKVTKLWLNSLLRKKNHLN